MNDYDHGKALMQQQKYPEAIASYQEALRHTDKDIKQTILILPALGNAYDAVQNFTASSECYRQALKLKIQNPLAHYFLACALEKIGQYQQALTEYNRAIHFDPECIGAYVKRGNLFMAFGQDEEARQDYDEVLKRSSAPMPADAKSKRPTPTCMNERAQHLVNAPTSVAPRIALITAREINKAIDRNVNGGNYGVYCRTDANVFRVYRARNFQGQLQVKIEQSGWVVPREVYCEG